MTDSAIAAAKVTLRQTMAERRAAIPAGTRRAASTQLAHHAGQLALPAGSVVSGYAAIRSEIDPLALLVLLADAGHVLALPRIEGTNIRFRRWAPDDPLVPGRWGLSEPSTYAPVVTPNVMLLPLLAFDRHGRRLGYGGGYYDRALERERPRLAIGIAFAAQEIEAVPTEAHDRPLDLILTEQGLIDAGRPGGA